METKQIAYKFVNWGVGKLEELKTSFPYRLKTKVLKNKKITRKEKNQLYAELQHNSYSKTGIPLHGYMFDFSDVLNEYFIEMDHGGIFKVFAIDKTSIRENERGIKKIVLSVEKI